MYVMVTYIFFYMFFLTKNLLLTRIIIKNLHDVVLKCPKCSVCFIQTRELYDNLIL